MLWLFLLVVLKIAWYNCQPTTLNQTVIMHWYDVSLHICKPSHRAFYFVLKCASKSFLKVMTQSAQWGSNTSVFLCGHSFKKKRKRKKADMACVQSKDSNIYPTLSTTVEDTTVLTFCQRHPCTVLQLTIIKLLKKKWFGQLSWVNLAADALYIMNCL